MTSKIVLTGVAILGLAPATLAGDCPSWHDNFESYALGAIGNQGAWELWGLGSPPLASLVSVNPEGAGKVLRVTGSEDAVVRFDSAEATGVPLISGAHTFSTLIYNPSSSTGAHYFIMLNLYDEHLGTGGTNWSVQVNMDRGANTVTDEGQSGASVPLVEDEWVQIEVLVDVDNNKQYFYLDGEVFYTGNWAGHVSADPGFVKLDALDYWGNLAGHAYYDDSSVNWNWSTGQCEQPAIIGACCLVDGTCIPDVTEPSCTATAGFHNWNLFAPCTGDLCPAYVAGEGWQITGEFVFQGDTDFLPDECSFGGPDELFAIEIPYTAPWTFSVCGGAAFDTYLALGSSPCDEDIASDDDSCGVQSEITELITVPPGPGGTVVYLAVTSLFGESGPYTLTVSAPCVGAVTPAGAPETEACGADLNGGCNMATPAFEPIAIGQQKNGTNWIDSAGTRDTDWYQFTNLDGNLRWAFVGSTRVGDVIECGGGFDGYNVRIDQAAAGADTTMELSGESSITFGMIAATGGAPSTDCATAAVISPAFFTVPCQGQTTTSGVIEAGAACVPSDGDTDDDGDVDVNDLLTVLGDWGCAGACDGDVDCDNDVDVNDLLDVLGNWS